jgi:phage FluMu gp28-like protein
VESFLGLLEPVWKPHPGQREFLLNEASTKVLACGRRWGKTDACAASVVAALHRDHPTRHLLLAPTAAQAGLLFERVVSMLGMLYPEESNAFAVKRSPHAKLTFGEHVVNARSGHVGRSLRGDQATHIVVDEAAYVPEELITEVAMPMLATTEGQLTLISTPHGKNHFWKFFRFGQRGEHGVWSKQAPSRESPYVSRRFLQAQRQLVSERAFRVEYEAEFVDAAGRVFRSVAVDACLVPKLPAEVRGSVAIGVDWARYGDYTAVAVLVGHREAGVLTELHKFHGVSWVESVRRVADILSRHPGARVICDATGVGDPVLEMLRRAAPKSAVEGLVLTASNKQELIDALAWAFEKQALRMTPDPDLIRELEHFEATPSASGHSKLAATGGYHDDLVTALALAVRGLPVSSGAIIQAAVPRNFKKNHATIRESL